MRLPLYRSWTSESDFIYIRVGGKRCSISSSIAIDDIDNSWWESGLNWSLDLEIV